MTDDLWDYSQIPKRKWKWYFEEDHWMELEVDSSGLTYYGTDWTCQSGGGYFGGFQTFEEFLAIHSLQKMPSEIRAEVNDYLLQHRKIGGSFLKLRYILAIPEFHLDGVFVHLDESPIHVKNVENSDDITIFEGSIAPGVHHFSFVFVLKSDESKKKVSGKFEITVQDGKNSVTIETIDDDEGNLLTRFVEEDS